MENIITKKTNEEIGLVEQLHTMLTNHPERPTFHLDVALINSGGTKIKEDSFDIYAREPKSKIEGKVEKLRTRGGYPTLRIVKYECAKENLELVLQV